ncbi:MAG: hypothetical protein ACREM3_17620 [Candidatus Rokuibacteriota bacterium]
MNDAGLETLGPDEAAERAIELIRKAAHIEAGPGGARRQASPGATARDTMDA